MGEPLFQVLAPVGNALLKGDDLLFKLFFLFAKGLGGKNGLLAGQLLIGLAQLILLALELDLHRLGLGIERLLNALSRRRTAHGGLHVDHQDNRRSQFALRRRRSWQSQNSQHERHCKRCCR